MTIAPSVSTALAAVAPVEPFRSPRFRRLFGAQFLSLAGDNVANVSAAFAALALGGSALSVGLVVAARVLPIVIFTLLGGVLADRFDRARLMATMDAVRCVSQGTLAALLLTGHATVELLVAFQVVNGIATAMFRPAITALITETVEQQHLQQANAALGLCYSTGSIAGFVGAGVVVAFFGVGWAFALDAVTFLLSALLLRGIRSTAVRVANGGAQVRASIVHELRSGLGEVRGRSWFWIVTAHHAFFQVGVWSAFLVLGPVVAEAELDGAGSWAMIMVGLGIGSILGDVVAMHWRPSMPLSATLVLGLGAVPALALLAAAAPAGMIALAQLATGAAIAIETAIWLTVLQQQVPPRSLGKVTSYYWLCTMAVQPIGLVAIGPLADRFGVDVVLVVVATIVGAFSLLAAASRSVRAVRYVVGA